MPKRPSDGRPKGGKGVFMSVYDFDVDSIGSEEFDRLLAAVRRRLAREKIGYGDLEEMAKGVGRVPKCPGCGCADPASFSRDGYDPNGRERLRCRECGTRFGILSGTALSSCKLTLWQLSTAVELMTFNVPLDAVADVVGCHHNTALLTRRKVFETVASWQSRVRLSGVVFIDEVYVFDSSRPRDHFGPNRRGLNKDKCCVFLAVDQYKSMVAFFVGHGYPTSKEIGDALLPHLSEGAALKIVHDGLWSHRKAIAESGAAEEVHISTAKDEGSLRAMLLINSFSAWVKRYLDRFTGMDTEYLQDYLNWFVYLFRCKRQDEKWPKVGRIIRHVLLADGAVTRSSLPARRAAKRQSIEKRRAQNGKNIVKTGGKRGRPPKKRPTDA